MNILKPKQQNASYQEIVDLIKKIELEFNITNNGDDIRERAHECIKVLYLLTDHKNDEKPLLKPLEEDKSKADTVPLNEQASILPNEDKLTCFKDIEKQLTEITNVIKGLESKCSSINNSVQSQANSLYDIEQVKQTRIEEIVQNCQDDRYRKDKAKLIKRSIFQMALIRKTLYEFETQDHLDTDKERIDFLVDQLNNLLTFSETTLEQEMIERVEPAKEGSDVNLEQQEVIGYHPTKDKKMDGKVYRSVNPAYVWRLPYILKAKINEPADVIKTYRFLLESEQVIIYKR